MGEQMRRHGSVFSFIIMFIAFCLMYKTSQAQTGTTYQPELFAPGIISNQYSQRDAGFTPDMKEFYYSMSSPGFSVILVSKNINGKWSTPETVSFSGNYSDLEPFVTSDGKRLYFASNRPLKGTGEPKDFDIWYVDRTGNGWGTPVNLGDVINSEKDEFYPSLTGDGTIYFTAQRPDSHGDEDIYRSKLVDGKYSTPEDLDDSVNTKGGEFNSFIARDESYLMFTSMGWETGKGHGDIWICFRKNDGTWTKAMNMGESVNSPSFEFCPSVTPDGKFLFFTSNRKVADPYSNKKISYQDLLDQLNKPANGWLDIYKVDAGVIDLLKKKAGIN